MNTRVGKSRAIIPNRTPKRHTYKNINCVLWVWLSELAKKYIETVRGLRIECQRTNEMKSVVHKEKHKVSQPNDNVHNLMSIDQHNKIFI